MWVVAVEGLRGQAALVRSITLVSGHWWTVFWRLFFLGFVCLLAFVLGLLAVIVFSPAAFFLYMISETLALIVSVAGAGGGLFGHGYLCDVCYDAIFALAL